MSYSISEMSKRLGIPASTIRYYDKEGLLPFLERSPNGIRIFRDSDYEWLKTIECLKKTGMQLSAIREFIKMAMLGDETIDSRLELIRAQRECVKNQLAELQSTLETLDFKCWYYETAQKTGTTSMLRSMSSDEFPQEYRAVCRRLRGK